MHYLSIRYDSRNCWVIWLFCKFDCIEYLWIIEFQWMNLDFMISPMDCFLLFQGWAENFYLFMYIVLSDSITEATSWVKSKSNALNTKIMSSMRKKWKKLESGVISWKFLKEKSKDYSNVFMKSHFFICWSLFRDSLNFDYFNLNRLNHTSVKKF